MTDIPVEAVHAGSKQMPPWNVGTLADAPKFGWKNWTMMLGPGLVMGAASIGGGEWLTGPMVTAKYGGGLLWLATLSILGQVIYNIEISRYTLYTGEPIFTGKFRTFPGPFFWVIAYLVLDFGSIFPYLAAFAATPLATAILGHVPRPDDPTAFVTWFGVTLSHKVMLRLLSYGIFLGALVPLVFGGKVYNSLKAVMSFKLVTVMGFLLVLGLFYSEWETWTDILSGFFKFGNVPVRHMEDLNENHILDPGEDWDSDGHLDFAEPSLKLKFGTMFRAPYATDINADGKPDPMVNLGTKQHPQPWPDLDRDGQPDRTYRFDIDEDGKLDEPYSLDANGDGGLDNFIDIDHDGIRDGDNLDNVILAAIEGRPLPHIDWTMIGVLSALVAISGSGGLTNTIVSNYTRDQGWGMGRHVGAIPSVVGGQDLQLSHVGTVFLVDESTLPRWKRWYRHITRDQLVVWMPACFFGLALPSMLSVQFLRRGFEVPDKWVAATMTADGVQHAVEQTNPHWGPFFWFMTIFCGFLVLGPSMAQTADGIIRRWVDVFWTSSGTLRKLNPKNVRYVYFGVLTVYAIFGMTMLSVNQPTDLLVIATMIYNFALGFSCWHALIVNLVLLPKELRPGWFVRIALFLAGAFFWTIAVVSTAQRLGYI